MKTRNKEREQLIRERLEKLTMQNGGRLTPALVVEDAKDPTSPLHEEFDWDLEASAMRSWLDRAREIIRSVRVEIHTEETVIRAIAYVRDPSAEYHDQGYVTPASLREEPTAARAALTYECERAVAAMHRAREVAAALGLSSEIDDILARLESVIVRASA